MTHGASLELIIMDGYKSKITFEYNPISKQTLLLPIIYFKTFTEILIMKVEIKNE